MHGNKVVALKVLDGLHCKVTHVRHCQWQHHDLLFSEGLPPWLKANNVCDDLIGKMSC